MWILRKLLSKLRASLYLFRKAEILKKILNKEINGEYDNLCPQCYFNERYQERAKLTGLLEPDSALRISIYLGGALGDYIVYLRFVDEVSAVYKCKVDIFLDRIEFGEFVYGKRENVTIIHDAENCLFQNSANHYDLAVHLDHGLILKHCSLGSIREKAPDFYVTACKIVEYTRSNHIDISNQHERESVILRRAKFSGETKWSKISCGGAVDMSSMYSSIVLEADALSVLDRHQLRLRRYITVNYGADKNMGGTAQTKVLPAQTLTGFIAEFKMAHPDYLVVQTGVRNSLPLPGADRHAFDCKLEETAVILKYSSCHIDSEGGLVHLASQLSTPCVVAFGPTPSYYYGYPRNENIVSPACSDCMSTTNRWSVVCPRGMQVPACMQAISEEMISERVDSVLGKKTDASPLEKDMDIAATVEIILLREMPLNICIVGLLDDEIGVAVESICQRGHSVSLYIPLSLDDELIALRTHLRQQGIRVEYGNILNVPCEGNTFDYVIFKQSRSIYPQEYVQREYMRLVKEGGQVIRCEMTNDCAACIV